MDFSKRSDFRLILITPPALSVGGASLSARLKKLTQRKRQKNMTKKKTPVLDQSGIILGYNIATLGPLGHILDNKFVPKKIVKKNRKHKIADIWPTDLPKNCYYCGVKFTEENPLTIDHKIPRAQGGKNNINNYAPACKKCNKSKDCLSDQGYIDHCIKVAAHHGRKQS